ncbi:hypothetical protein Tco_0448422, partial [Tanacetum coccineum]
MRPKTNRWMHHMVSLRDMALQLRATQNRQTSPERVDVDGGRKKKDGYTTKPVVNQKEETWQFLEYEERKGKNHGCGFVTKIQENGFFYVDRRAIPHSMPLRHADSVITEPKPPANTHDIANVQKLSQFVVKLPDILEGDLVLSGLSRVWKNPSCDPALRDSKNAGIGRACGVDFHFGGSKVHEEPHNHNTTIQERLPFYCTPSATIGAVIHDLTSDELAATEPSAKVLAKVEASKKRRASTSSSAGDDDDDDEVDEDVVNLGDDVIDILHVTPITSATKLPSRGNQPFFDSFHVDVREESFGHVNDVHSNGGIGQSAACGGTDPHVVRLSSALSDAVGDKIKRDLFPCIPGPKELFKDPKVCRAVVDQFPTLNEVIRVEAVGDDQRMDKMNVLHCLMISHGRELMAQFRVLIKTYDEYRLKSEAKDKSLQQQLSSINSLNYQVTNLKRQVDVLQDQANTFVVAPAKAKEKSKGHKKKVKYLNKVIDQLTSETTKLGFVRADIEVVKRTLSKSIRAISQFRSAGGSPSLVVNVGFEQGLRVNCNEEQLAEVMSKVSMFVPSAKARLDQVVPLVATLKYPFLDKVSDCCDHPLADVVVLIPRAQFGQHCPCPFKIHYCLSFLVGAVDYCFSFNI